MSKNFYDYIGEAIASTDVWGFHCIVDCEDCDKSTVNSEGTIESFLDRMVNTLGLIPVGKPICYSFDDGNGRGVSGLQLITTSHISCHTDDDAMSAYIDFFSCGKFDKTVVNKGIGLVKEFFNPGKMKIKVLLRSANKIVEVNV